MVSGDEDAIFKYRLDEALERPHEPAAQVTDSA